MLIKYYYFLFPNIIINDVTTKNIVEPRYSYEILDHHILIGKNM